MEYGINFTFRIHSCNLSKSIYANGTMFFEKYFKTYIYMFISLTYSLYIYVLMTLRLTGMRLTGTPGGRLSAVVMSLAYQVELGPRFESRGDLTRSETGRFLSIGTSVANVIRAPC